MSHSAENVAQCRKCRTVPKNSITYLNTLPNLFPTFIHRQPLDSIPLYIESSRQPIRIEHKLTTRVVSQSESSTTRVGSTRKHASTTREASRGLGRPFSALGSSRTAIAYLKTCGSSIPPPFHLICLLLYNCSSFFAVLIPGQSFCKMLKLSMVVFQRCHQGKNFAFGGLTLDSQRFFRFNKFFEIFQDGSVIIT